MGCTTSKPSQDIQEKSIEVELQISMRCEKCVNDVKKVIFNFPGVVACKIDMDNQKVMVGGAFNLEGLLEKIEKKLGKKAVVPEKEKEDDVAKEDDVMVQEKDGIIEVKENIDAPETSAKEGTKKDEIYIENLEVHIGKVVSKFKGLKKEKDDVVQEKDEIVEVEEKIDTPGTSETKLEINLPFLCENLELIEVEIGKVISKFQGVKDCSVDTKNKKVVITGDFDKKKLWKKIERRVNKKINKIEKEKNIEACEINSDEEKVKERFMMFSDENPNACSIS